jgi:hypothetical protein
MLSLPLVTSGAGAMPSTLAERHEPSGFSRQSLATIHRAACAGSANESHPFGVKVDGMGAGGRDTKRRVYEVDLRSPEKMLGLLHNYYLQLTQSTRLETRSFIHFHRQSGAWIVESTFAPQSPPTRLS